MSTIPNDPSHALAPHLTADLKEAVDLIDCIIQKNDQAILLDGGDLGFHSHLLHLLQTKQNINFNPIPVSQGIQEFKNDIRKATVLRVAVPRMAYEGEVTDLTPAVINESRSRLILRRCVNWRNNKIGLATTADTKSLHLSRRDLNALHQEQITIGDTVEIDCENGAVTKMGRIGDTEGGGVSQRPEGSVHKRKVKIQEITLYELDNALKTPIRAGGIYSLLSEQPSPVDVDKFVKNLMEKKWATVNPGVIYIAEAQNLTEDFFSVLTDALQTSICSSVYLSSTQTICQRSGANITTDSSSIPAAFLSRLVVIQPQSMSDTFEVAATTDEDITEKVARFTFYLGRKYFESQKLFNIVVDWVKIKQSKCVILVGSGNEELAFQMGKKLGGKDKFCQMFTKNEDLSSVLKTLEVNLRQAVGVKWKPKYNTFYEGEVTYISLEEDECKCGISGESTIHVIIRLKTDNEEKQLKIKEQLSNAMIKDKVAVGDIVSIDSQLISFKKIGRNVAYEKETNHEGRVYVPIPKGKVLKTDLIRDISLHDLDKEFTAKQKDGIYALLRMQKPHETDASSSTESLEMKVNKIVTNLINGGGFELHRGILFIDDIDEMIRLDEECETKIFNDDSMTEMSPIIVLATRDTAKSSQHGMFKNNIPMLIIHADDEACSTPKSVEQGVEPRDLHLLVALEMEAKFVDGYIAINSLFGAGAMMGFMLAVFNSESPPRDLIYLVCLLASCTTSVILYWCAHFNLQRLIKKAKEVKDTNEVWVKKSKTRLIRFQILVGFLFGTLAVCWVIVILLSYFLGKYEPKRFNDRYITLAVALMVMLGSYLMLAVTSWKKLPLSCSLKNPTKKTL